MVITIQIQSQQEYQWLTPFLEALEKKNIKVQLNGGAAGEEDFFEKRKAYIRYLKEHAIPVKKVETPDRDERNAR